jgi:hypothetical protein
MTSQRRLSTESGAFFFSGGSMPRKAATWVTSVIWTRAELDRKRRRLDRRNCSAEQVLSEMRRGHALHLSFSPREHWVLSNGAFVTDTVARAVIAHADVHGVGDTLIAGGLSQTFRYVK